MCVAPARLPALPPSRSTPAARGRFSPAAARACSADAHSLFYKHTQPAAPSFLTALHVCAAAPHGSKASNLSLARVLPTRPPQRSRTPLRQATEAPQRCLQLNEGPGGRSCTWPVLKFGSRQWSTLSPRSPLPARSRLTEPTWARPPAQCWESVLFNTQLAEQPGNDANTVVVGLYMFRACTHACPFLPSVQCHQILFVLGRVVSPTMVFRVPAFVCYNKDGACLRLCVSV